MELADRARACLNEPQVVVENWMVNCGECHGVLLCFGVTVVIEAAQVCAVTLEDPSGGKRAELHQAGTLHRYKELLESIPAGVVVYNALSKTSFMNAQAQKILGPRADGILEGPAANENWRILDENNTPLAFGEYPLSRVIASGENVADVVVGVQHDLHSEPTWIICNAFAKFSPQGAIQEVVVSFTDITALKRATSHAQSTEEMFNLTLKGSDDAPWNWNLRMDTFYCSDRWWHMMGYEVDELPNSAKLWRSLFRPEDKALADKKFKEIMKGAVDSFRIELSLRHKLGHYVPVLSKGFILRDEKGVAIRISGTNVDLTERRAAEAEIHQLAFYDALTGLPNRRLLLEQLKKAMLSISRDRTHGALFFIDLDNFKELNDTLGHDVGDQLLRQVAQRLLGCVRKHDVVARLGGDEFVIMVEGLGLGQQASAVFAEQIAKSALCALGKPYEIDGRPYKGTASIGLAMLADDSPSMDVVLKQADLAMYQSKSAGRNTVRFFDASMQAAIDKRVSIEGDLRDAIAKSQLEVHYQPQVVLESGKVRVIGAELLLRWEHPARGRIPPNDFIPLAEETGLIIPIGQWVLEQACDKIAQWSGVPGFGDMALAVNVSAIQFHDPGFVGVVMAALERAGANPERLKIELTESALAKNIEEVIGKMRFLREKGVTFSLDDFGTGYSSLSYLKRMPLDQLKIDRSFVNDALIDSNGATLARVIISLGVEMGLSVIAEGVETDGQRAFLQNAGCMQYQGYFFGRPLPLRDFEDFVRSK